MTQQTTPRAPSPPAAEPAPLPVPRLRGLPGLRQIIISVTIVALLTTVGILVTGWLRGPQKPQFRANPRPPLLSAGPVEASNIVVGADGVKMSCPSGSAPNITINNASFDPPLADGRTFAKGRYRITLQGLVINETTADITIDTYPVTVDGVAWKATVTAPATLRGGTSHDITVAGVYDSAGPTQASIHVAMNWVWSAAILQPCGKTGLIEDD